MTQNNQHNEIPKDTVAELVAFIEIDGVAVALFESEVGMKLTVSGSNEYVKEIPLTTIYNKGVAVGRVEEKEEIKSAFCDRGLTSSVFFDKVLQEAGTPLPEVSL